MQGKDRTIQLLECCDETLRRDLTRIAGGSLADKTEKEVLSAIKQLAIQHENLMVARVALHNMKQDRDEPIRSFGARVRGQANICDLTVKCTAAGCEANVDYTHITIRDIVLKGLADQDNQQNWTSWATATKT